MKTRKAKNVKKKLKMLKKAEMAVRDGTYATTSCPICFEHFHDPKVCWVLFDRGDGLAKCFNTGLITQFLPHG